MRLAQSSMSDARLTLLSSGHFCINCKKYALNKIQKRSSDTIYNYECCSNCGARSMSMANKKPVAITHKRAQ